MSSMRFFKDMARSAGREARKAKDAIQDYAAGPHTIGVGNRELSRLDSRLADVMKDKGVENLKVRLKENLIHVTGRFSRGSGGAFDVDITPDGITWDENNHVLFFRIVRQDVAMDNKVVNALQIAVSRTCNALFGDAFLNEQLGVVDEDGRLRIALDGEDDRLDAIMDSMVLHRLACEDERLRITFTPRLKKALAHAKTVWSWWRSRDKTADDKPTAR